MERRQTTWVVEFHDVAIAASAGGAPSIRNARREFASEAEARRFRSEVWDGLMARDPFSPWAEPRVFREERLAHACPLCDSPRRP